MCPVLRMDYDTVIYKNKKIKKIDNKKIEEMGEKKDGVAPSSSR